MADNARAGADRKPDHTIDVGYVHVTNDERTACVPNCPHPEHIGSEDWLRERFPDKDWHRHPRTDGQTDLCDGTPSDCAAKVRL